MPEETGRQQRKKAALIQNLDENMYHMHNRE
jgi:hypothetical protein